MPIALHRSGVPWARYKVTTNKLAFSMEGQTGEVDFKGLQFAADPENATIGWLQIVRKKPETSSPAPSTSRRRNSPAPSINGRSVC